MKASLANFDYMEKSASSEFTNTYDLKYHRLNWIIDPAENFIVRKEKMGQLDNGLLLKLVREDKIPEFVAGLGRLSNIDPETVRQAVFDSSAEKLAVICKAIDINYDVFGEIIFCVNMIEERESTDMEDLLGVYNRITPQVAQKALRFLRTRKNLMMKTL